MVAERYLSRRITDLRVGNDIDKIDKNPVPSIYTSLSLGLILFYSGLLDGTRLSPHRVMKKLINRGFYMTGSCFIEFIK